MSAVMAIFVPLMVCALFAGAIHVLWRRVPDAPHGASWLAAFWLMALGWAAQAIETALAGNATLPGGASALCWLAAALLGARGLRQRGRRPDRGLILLAIWVGTAIGVSIRLDVGLMVPAMGMAMTFVLAGAGAAIAAVAIGPRHRFASLSAWAAAGMLGAFGILCLAMALMAFSSPAATLTIVPWAEVPLTVMLGIGAMMALNDDRAYQLQRLARTDPLTGILNRRGFEEAGQHILARHHARGGTLAAVAIADIDGFKAINDDHGHAIGDAALVRFADTLRGVTEKGDVLARLGGEEFAILAIGASAVELRHRLDRVRSLLGVPTIDPRGLPNITASFGVAEFDGERRVLREALERADRALYRAKHEGRNRVTLAD